MCNWCESDGWKRRTCSICGDGHPAVISISISTDDPSAPFPYTTLDLCLECGQQDPMGMAVAQNRATREAQGLTALDL